MHNYDDSVKLKRQEHVTHGSLMLGPEWFGDAVSGSEWNLHSHHTNHRQEGTVPWPSSF